MCGRNARAPSPGGERECELSDRPVITDGSHDGGVHEILERLDGSIREGARATAVRQWFADHGVAEKDRRSKTLEMPPPSLAENDRSSRLSAGLIDVKAAAAHVGVHRNTIYEAVKRGDLKVRRVGRLLRFTIDDLDQWTRRT
jgi:excisionase family DNA binding protein